MLSSFSILLRDTLNLIIFFSSTAAGRAQQSNGSMRKCAWTCFRLMLLRVKIIRMLVSINNIAHLNARDRFFASRAYFSSRRINLQMGYQFLNQASSSTNYVTCAKKRKRIYLPPMSLTMT